MLRLWLFIVGVPSPLVVLRAGYVPCIVALVLSVGGPFTEAVLRKFADGEPLFILGDPSSINFTADLTIENIAFEGVTGNTPAVFRSYDMVRSTIDSCLFRNGSIGFESLGGISNRFVNCIFEFAEIGLKFDKFVSNAGGGYPNLNILEKCIMAGNTKWGIWFDNGRVLTCNDCDIEGNGTLNDATTGGVYVGPNIGSEGSTPNSIATILNSCWFEANQGKSSLVFEDGKNYVNDCYFVFNLDTDHSIYIKGGNYFINNCHADEAKSQSIYEESTVNSGNEIFFSTFPGFELDELSGTIYNPLKTTVFYQEGIKHKGGSYASVPNVIISYDSNGYRMDSYSGCDNNIYSVI
nr:MULTISPECIES: hypothetical protein [unclassified Paenibacillus]